MSPIAFPARRSPQPRVVPEVELSCVVEFECNLQSIFHTFLSFKLEDNDREYKVDNRQAKAGEIVEGPSCRKLGELRRDEGGT